MTSDHTSSLYLAAGLSAVIAIATLMKSRRDSPIWILDPRGPFSLMICLHACGLAAYVIMYGEPPRIFGLQPSLIAPATWMLVFGQLGFLLGSFVAPRTAMSRLPKLPIERSESQTLDRILALAVIVISGIRLIQLAVFGLEKLSSRYGSVQTGDVSMPAIFSVGALSVPLFVLWVVLHAMRGRRLWSPSVATLGLLVATPSLVGGGRRDILLIIGAFAIAYGLQRLRLNLRMAATFALAMWLASYAVQLSRGGESMQASDRVSALSAEREEDDRSAAQSALLMFSGTAVLTASMTIFPSLVDHSVGTTYFQSGINMLAPRFLFGEYIFEPPSLAFRRMFYPTVSGHGMDYSLAAEAYQNFGNAGPFLLFLLLGSFLSVLFSVADESLRRNQTSYWVLFHCQAMISLAWALRTDSNGAVKLVAYGISAISVLAFFSKIMLTVQIKQSSIHSSTRRRPDRFPRSVSR